MSNAPCTSGMHTTVDLICECALEPGDAPRLLYLVVDANGCETVCSYCSWCAVGALGRDDLAIEEVCK